MKSEINILLDNIKNNTNVRGSLSELRRIIKDEKEKERLYKAIERQEELLLPLLSCEDGKTRKNVALLIGDLALEEYVESLFRAYSKEEQLFVKSSYLIAMKNLDYSLFLDEIKKRLSELEKMKVEVNEEKHVKEEIKALWELVVIEEGIVEHKFIGYYEKYDCILVTNREHKEITANQIINGACKDFVAGVRVVTSDIQELLEIRTYSEMLFVVEGMRVCSTNHLEAAKTIAQSDLLPMLSRIHKGNFPFCFRIDLKSKMPLDKKSDFIKKFSFELEKATERKLINSASNYEFEIRLIQNKDGNYNCLIKLNTLPEDRFTYRKEHIAASIKPVNAALLVQLAKEYMINDARVLDPFCGVGTMLIERQKIVKAQTSYGIDVLEEAILKAKTNTKLANQIIHFVNRDFETFTHEHLFDEIFTHMPFPQGTRTDKEVYLLYDMFFKRAKELLSETGTIIMYSHNKEFAKAISNKYNYKIIKEFNIHKREETDLIIIKV